MLDVVLGVDFPAEQQCIETADFAVTGLKRSDFGMVTNQGPQHPRRIELPRPADD
jgi:hypothetical protein